MKYKAGLIAILWGSLLSLASPLSAQNSLQRQKDSLRQVIEHSEGIDKLRSYNRLYYLYMSEIADDQKMDTLLMLLKQVEAEAIKQGNAQMQGMVYGNAIIAHINRSEHDKVIEKAPAYLDFYIENGLWRFYYQIHMQLITAYNLKGEYELAVEEAEKMYARAKERKDKAGMATALYATGIVYNSQDRWKEEEKCFRECIGLLWEVSGYDNILTQSYAFLCTVLRAQNRYDDLLQLVPEYENAIARFEKAAGRAQPEARGNLYIALMNTYIDIREYDKAEPYLAKIEGLINNDISRFELLRARALILRARGDYGKALAAVDSAMTRTPEADFNRNSLRRIKMQILARMGRYREADGLLDEIIATNDTLKNVEVNARFDELRIQYEVEKHIAEKERNFHYLLFALAICLIFALLLAGTFYYNRMIALKNRKLYERIKEQDRLADELSRLAGTRRLKTSPEASPDESGKTGGATDGLAPCSEQQNLVARLQEYLLSGDNLSDTDISRDNIISALGTNKNALTDAVKAVTGKSPMEYMRTLRVEEARRKLDSHPELTIEAIAFSCGFNIPSTFYRLFRKQYGISPTEYRKMAKSQEK
ncbi:helix-turn-helix domain-containing protein [uncultured Bacteroides sp.]|uniref:helix-turn-helix domain-containing protein n=1 Tax=uncultured Bacteroides sp. TaxID=162156 RepID=UPI0025FA6EEF|nr:helix-turn-helix domain-containing protein [uncultured Bacteroides sp.]